LSRYNNIAATLTLRQREILVCKWAGASDEQIAVDLGLSADALNAELALMLEIADHDGWRDLLAPLEIKPPPLVDTGVESHGDETVPASGSTARVLLADDQPIGRLGVQHLLSPLGVDLEMAADGAEAVEKFRSGQFDLVLMDIDMPVMDGLAAVRAIREHERRSEATPALIAMLTAHISPEHRRAAWVAGANTHLAKPLDPNQLLTIVRGVARAIAG